jgi:hypothetical protein
MTEFERGWAAAREAAAKICSTIEHDHLLEEILALQCPEQPAEAPVLPDTPTVRFMIAEAEQDAEPAAQSADKDAARWRAFRHLGTCGKDPEEILGPILESLFPQNEERVPTGEEIDAVADGVVAALAQQAGKEQS